GEGEELSVFQKKSSNPLGNALLFTVQKHPLSFFNIDSMRFRNSGLLFTYRSSFTSPLYLLSYHADTYTLDHCRSKLQAVSVVFTHSLEVRLPLLPLARPF
ncbi:hypothetical protein, partial [Paenibacillus oceani]|uniref:hypothetical protein n=1 Tax=Paenibacillus oceani TaxID=2772510 RepID=UPI001CC2468F